jgi:hypothetical protein
MTSARLDERTICPGKSSGLILAVVTVAAVADKMTKILQRNIV